MRSTLRYLLIVALMSMTSVLSAANAAAQNLAQRPEAQMQSTSVLQGSGSALPQAALDGPYTTYDAFSASGTTPNGPNRAKKGWGEGGSDRPEPYEDPLGDAAFPFALCALAYLIVRAVRTHASNERVKE